MNNAFEKGLNYALYLLSLKMRTTNEMKTKLIDKEMDEALVEQIIQYLIDQKYLDDTLYASTYIRTRRERYGDFRIDNELKRKGISKATIDLAKQSLIDEEEAGDAFDYARGVLDKKMATLTIDWDRLRNDYKYKYGLYQKLAGFLSNRGFSGSVIKAVIGERLSEQFFDE